VEVFWGGGRKRGVRVLNGRGPAGITLPAGAVPEWGEGGAVRWV
jgi:hypothetical protein